MMNKRCEKFKYLHQLLKKESEDIRYILEQDKQDYKEVFDEQMGKPIDVLERWFDESNISN